jgi:nucleotide-binding universal stress UspA family protein
MATIAMRVLVLVDGQHSREILGALARLIALRDAELILVYVQGPGPRAGLDLLQDRPGGLRRPPHRERELMNAEDEESATALAEAVPLARSLASAVETAQVRGEPGPAVCDLAKRAAVDLVAIRAGGRDQPVGPKSLGPTARFVSDHSPCPVLLLRGGARG